MPILPDFAAATFEPGAPIDNPYNPLTPGVIRSYGAAGEGADENNDVFATYLTKPILGVDTTVVRDTAYEDGVPVEDTLDWFAQDTEGNVWYMGELAYNYRYDDEGAYVGTDTDGSWQAGVDGAGAGYQMRAEPGFGAGYYQEFALGIAVDEAIVVGVNETVETDLGAYADTIRTLDTTALEPDVAEFKSYAPGVGEVLVREGLDSETGEAELRVELQGNREVAPGDGIEADQDIPLASLQEKQALAGVDATEDPGADEFDGPGSYSVTFLSEDAGFDNAVGAYTIDAATGALGEGRILFAGTEGLEAGTSAVVEVGEGEAMGVFVVQDGGNQGLDLDAFEDGGLFFENFLTGETATIEDGLAPLVTNADGDPLPVSAFHALGNEDGFNFLNPAAGVQGVELATPLIDDAVEDAVGDIEVLGFEDQLATSKGFDGDYNDVVLTVGEGPLAPELLSGLRGELLIG